MSQAARPGIATHYLRYTVGNVLIMLAGFVSFPIMTRLLNNTEYGIFGVFDTWLLILGGLFKLGAQHSIVRFYPHRGGNSALAGFGANFLLLPALCSMGFLLLAAITFGIYSAVRPSPHDTIDWIVLALLLPTMCISYVTAVLMAEERSELSVRVSVGTRWLEMFAVIGIIYFLERNALGVYLGRLLAASTIMLGLVVWLWRRVPLHWRDRDIASWFAGVRYGVPMMANELSAVLLTFIDRLMLRQMLGAYAPVGVYTIGYGLAMNISSMLNAALGAAYTQVSVRQFETEGPAAVLRTKRAVLHVLVYVIAAMLLGLITVGSDALLLMAGHDKAGSAPVFVLIGINYTLGGLLGICSAGLVLYKRSGVIFAITFGAMLLNIALNLVWIPLFGVMGAVYATFASSIGLNIAGYLLCPRDLRALPDARAIFIACALGLLVWMVAHLTGLFGLTSHLSRIVVMFGLVLALFGLPALALDRKLRDALLDYWRKRRTDRG